MSFAGFRRVFLGARGGRCAGVVRAAGVCAAIAVVCGPAGVVRAQTLDLTPAARPDLGERSVVALTAAAARAELASRLDAVGLAAGAGAGGGLPASGLEGLAVTERARVLACALAAAVLGEAEGVWRGGDALAVEGLWAWRALDAVDGAAAEAAGAIERSRRAGASAGERVVGAAAWERFDRACGRMSGVVSGGRVEAGRVRWALAPVLGEGWGDGVGVGEVDAAVERARRALVEAGRAGEGSLGLDAEVSGAMSALLSVASAWGSLGRGGEAVEMAGVVEACVSLDGVLRRTRWARRASVDAARRALHGAVLVADGEGGWERRGAGEAMERLGRVARVRGIVDLARVIGAGRMDAGGTRDMVEALLVRAGDLEGGARLDGVLGSVERVLGAMRDRRDLPGDDEVGAGVRSVWRVMERVAVEREERVVIGLGRVLAQPDPMVGPAGASLIAGLVRLVEDLALLSRAGVLVESLEGGSRGDAGRAAGVRLDAVLGRARDAVGMGVRNVEVEDMAAMERALGEAVGFARLYGALMEMEGEGVLLAEDGRVLSACLMPRSPRSMDGGGLGRGVSARVRSDRSAWLRGWSGVGDGGDARVVGGASGALERLRVARRALVLLEDRAVVVGGLRRGGSGGGLGGGLGARLSGVEGVSLTEVEVRMVLGVGADALRACLEALAAGDGERASVFLARAEAAHAPVGVLARLVGAVDGGVAVGVGGVAGVSRWSSELAWVVRSVDASGRERVEDYLVEESGRVLARMGG